MVKRHAAAAKVFHTYGTEIRHLQNAVGQLVLFQCFDWNSNISPILGKTVQQVSWVKEIMTSIRFLIEWYLFCKRIVFSFS